jgi:hypothetical protein
VTFQRSEHSRLPSRMGTTNTAAGARALTLRKAERAGQLEPPAQLREEAQATGWPDEDIDAAFAALAKIEVRPLGDFLIVTSGLDGHTTAELTKQFLIQYSIPTWSLTNGKGRTMWELMHAYADPRWRWQSLLRTQTRNGAITLWNMIP